MSSLFSIICTVRNRADRIRACVESVLGQDDPGVEFVVQDGASDDGTLEILREYGSRLQLVSEPDAGAGDGMFRALARVRGDYWGSCLSDERLVPDAVSWARRTFAARPDLGAIYGYAEGVDRDGTLLSRQDAGEFSLAALLTYRQLPPFVATFFRMDAYRATGLTTYTGGGEFDLWARLAVRSPIRRFDKLVAYYGLGPGTLSNQVEVFRAERPARLEALRRLFHDDPAGKAYQHLEPLAYAGYFLRYAGMFVRSGDWELARESCREGLRHLGSIDRLPDAGDRLRARWLAYTVGRADMKSALTNVWAGLAGRGIRRVAIFGGEGWGLAIHRDLADIGIECVAAIENNAATRAAAMIPAPYYPQDEFLANGPQVDAVLSSLQGDHDRDVLAPLMGKVRVISWKDVLEPAVGSQRSAVGSRQWAVGSEQWAGDTEQ